MTGFEILLILLIIIFIASMLMDFSHHRICYHCGKTRFSFMLEYLGTCWFCKVKELLQRSGHEEEKDSVRKTIAELKGGD